MALDHLRRPLRAAAVVFVTAFALTACASVPAAQPAPAPSSPSATPTTEPEPIGPVAAFGGDCDDVLTPDQVMSILGAGARDKETWLAEVSPPARSALPVPITTLGGIECEWVAAEGAVLPEGMSSISILALPVDAVTDIDFSEPLCEPSYDAVNCRMSRTESGVWLLARAGWYLETAPTEQLDAALTAAAANVASFPPPISAARDSAWWQLPTCDDIAAEVGLRELLGTDFFSGFYEGSPQPEHKLLDDAGVSRLCPWSTDPASMAEGDSFHIITLQMMPGGAVWWDEMVANPRVSPHAIAGAESALIVDGRDVFATDGVNVVSLRESSPEADVELAALIAERVLAALNAG